MAYYDALIAAWNAGTPPQGGGGIAFAGTDTTVQKLAKVNGWTVAGPNVDVAVGDVVGYLALQGKLTALQSYAAAPPSGSNAQAVTAAKELVTLLTTPSITVFRMSAPATNTAVQNFLNALAADQNSGIAAADVTALLALAATTKPWWRSAGYSSPIATTDLAAAGGLS